MPKEIRNLKSDWRIVLDEAEANGSACWGWADEADDVAGMLREDSTKPPPPNLMERVAVFGEMIIRFAKKIPRGIDRPENRRLIDQLVGAATSIGANYCEADDSISGKDFKHKISISRKESKETMFFLRMIAASEESLADETRKLWREAKELNLIFGAIWRK